MHYVTRYDKRHPKIKDAGESKLINSFIPRLCEKNFVKTKTVIKT